ncbi:hypothetical protein BGX27_002727, partial [Mortierella sp. AM989]
MSSAPSTPPPADMSVTASDSEVPINDNSNDGLEDHDMPLAVSRELVSGAFISVVPGLQQPTPPPSSTTVPLTWPAESHEIKSFPKASVGPAILSLSTPATADASATLPLSTHVKAQKRAMVSAAVPSAKHSGEKSRSPSPVSTSSLAGGHGGAISEAAARNRVEGQKTRFTFAENHVVKLEKVFKTEQYPNRALKAELSELIGCSEKQIANWFDRRRIFERKTNQASTNSSPASTTTAPQNAPSPSPAPSVEEDNPTDGILGTAAFTDNNNPLPKPTPSKLSSNKVALRLVRITQSNMIRKPSDVKAAIELMEEAADWRSPFLKSEFVRLKGHGVLCDWLIEVREDPGTLENKDLMRRTIEVLNELPLELDDIMVRGVGKVMNRIARNKDETIDKDTSERAAKVVKKWKDLVQGPTGTDSGSRPSVDKNGRGVKRDREETDDRQPLHEGVSRPLPKFIKGTPVGPVETIKKPNIVENSSFFDQLRARPSTSSTSGAKSSSSPASATPAIISTSPTRLNPTPATPAISAPKEIAEAPSEDTSSSTATVTAATAIVPTPTDQTVPPSSLPSQPSLTVEFSTSADSSEGQMAASSTDMEVDEPTIPSSPKKGKGKRVRWKADHELVSIQFIEPRGEVVEHEEEHANHDYENDQEHGNTDMYQGTNESFNSSHLSRQFPPQFMMSEESIEVLVRGDVWRPPMLLQLEATSPVRGSKSVEKDVQEKRESETLSANYLQIAYIPPSPAEPEPELVREGTINTAAVLAALSAVATAKSNANAT